MTPLDYRLRSGGYILPAIGIALWLASVGAPLFAWFTDPPIYNRNTGLLDAAFSIPTVLFAIVSAVFGTILILIGNAIRRTYRNGKRSGL